MTTTTIEKCLTVPPVTWDGPTSEQLAEKIDATNARAARRARLTRRAAAWGPIPAAGAALAWPIGGLVPWGIVAALVGVCTVGVVLD